LASGDADGLAGEPAGNEVDPFELGEGEGPDVAVAGDVGPSMLEDPDRFGVVLDLPARLPAGAFESEIDAADPGE